MSNVYILRRRSFPASPVTCLERMLHSAKAGKLKGLTFIATLDGRDAIADTCGDASLQLEETRRLLKRLDAKLARRQLVARKGGSGE